jgi:CRP-like cAMP-binding protein
MLDVHSPLENSFLAALPTKVQDRLFAHLEFVPLPFGKVLHESGDTLHHVYFPTCAIVSLLYMLKNGTTAELAVVGNEGLVGVPLFLGGHSTTNRAVVQSAGYAYRLLWQRMKEESKEYPLMLSLVLRYTQALMAQIAQTAVCNRHHTIEQQLCRWLLVSLDRLPGNHLNMTQGLIANMLGVHRQGVNDAAGKLQKNGVISYCRGHIRILNRAKLEELSCECYTATRKETERLLPYVNSYTSNSGKQNHIENTSSIHTKNPPDLQVENTPPAPVPCNHYALNAAMEERRAEPQINAAQRKTYSLQD